MTINQIMISGDINTPNNFKLQINEIIFDCNRDDLENLTRLIGFSLSPPHTNMKDYFVNYDISVPVSNYEIQPNSNILETPEPEIKTNKLSKYKTEDNVIYIK